ncbi:MAG: class I SAM-dependent methyltransferase [Syntrophales bacterium]|nr:class I SAM-dependent methyltransferase [Syntrophales bacterium]
MDTSEYAIRVFNGHAEKIGLTNRLCGKTMLELGPGDSIATAIIAASHGARAILVDAGAFVSADIAPYHELVQVLIKQGLPTFDLSVCRTIDEILAHCGARYMTEGLTSLAQIESESVDLIFSQAVLEHLSKREFGQTMQECRRILRPNGICSHQVDLRDHLGDALNNLRFSERVWESEFFAKSGFYTNRIRYNQMLQLFSDAGFAVEVTDVQHWSVLPTTRCKLALEFKDLSDVELCVAGFDVLLR